MGLFFLDLRAVLCRVPKTDCGTSGGKFCFIVVIGLAAGLVVTSVIPGLFLLSELLRTTDFDPVLSVLFGRARPSPLLGLLRIGDVFVVCGEAVGVGAFGFFTDLYSGFERLLLYALLEEIREEFQRG